jgi:hypothetical protein
MPTPRFQIIALRPDDRASRNPELFGFASVYVRLKEAQTQDGLLIGIVLTSGLYHGYHWLSSASFHERKP